MTTERFNQLYGKLQERQQFNPEERAELQSALKPLIRKRLKKYWIVGAEWCVSISTEDTSVNRLIQADIDHYLTQPEVVTKPEDIAIADRVESFVVDQFVEWLAARAPLVPEERWSSLEHAFNFFFPAFALHSIHLKNGSLEAHLKLGSAKARWIATAQEAFSEQLVARLGGTQREGVSTLLAVGATLFRERLWQHEWSNSKDSEAVKAELQDVLRAVLSDFASKLRNEAFVYEQFRVRDEATRAQYFSTAQQLASQIEQILDHQQPFNQLYRGLLSFRRTEDNRTLSKLIDAWGGCNPPSSPEQHQEMESHLMEWLLHFLQRIIEDVPSIHCQLDGTSLKIEDVVQETWLAIVGLLHKFAPEYFFNGENTQLQLGMWMREIVLRVAGRLIEHERQHPDLSIDDEPEDDEPPQELYQEASVFPNPFSNPMDTAQLNDAVQRLKEALMSVDDDYRICLILFHHFRLSEAEIGHLLGIKVGTVKSRLSRGRDALQQELREHCSDFAFPNDKREFSLWLSTGLPEIHDLSDLLPVPQRELAESAEVRRSNRVCYEQPPPRKQNTSETAFQVLKDWAFAVEAISEGFRRECVASGISEDNSRDVAEAFAGLLWSCRGALLEQVSKMRPAHQERWRREHHGHLLLGDVADLAYQALQSCSYAPEKLSNSQWRILGNSVLEHLNRENLMRCKPNQIDEVEREIRQTLEQKVLLILPPDSANLADQAVEFFVRSIHRFEDDIKSDELDRWLRNELAQACPCRGYWKRQHHSEGG